MVRTGLSVLLMQAGTKGARAMAKAGQFPRPPFEPATAKHQAKRFSERFKGLVSEQTSILARAVPGADPHMVLVFETRGEERDFLRVVSATPGLEWLFDIEQEGLDPDDTFA